MKVLLLHGLHSSPGGSKAEIIKSAGHELINPALPADSWIDSLRIAQEAVDVHRPDVVVGSSRGGALAVNINVGCAKRVLIAPAWKRFGNVTEVPSETIILHSKHDDVVFFEESVELSNSSGAKLIEVGNDHRMNSDKVLATIVESL